MDKLACDENSDNGYIVRADRYVDCVFLGVLGLDQKSLLDAANTFDAPGRKILAAKICADSHSRQRPDFSMTHKATGWVIKD